MMGAAPRCSEDFVGERCEYKNVFAIIEEMKSMYSEPVACILNLSHVF